MTLDTLADKDDVRVVKRIKRKKIDGVRHHKKRKGVLTDVQSRKDKDALHIKSTRQAPQSCAPPSKLLKLTTDNGLKHGEEHSRERELAVSGRSMCQLCKTRISKNDWRWRKLKHDDQYGMIYTFTHCGCEEM
jgi:hypothetical protein